MAWLEAQETHPEGGETDGRTYGQTYAQNSPYCTGLASPPVTSGAAAQNPIASLPWLDTRDAWLNVIEDWLEAQKACEEGVQGLSCAVVLWGLANGK